METIESLFGQAVRKRRGTISQEDFADKVGVSTTFIGQVERGTNSPSFETMQKMAEVLEVDISELFLPPDKK